MPEFLPEPEEIVRDGNQKPIHLPRHLPSEAQQLGPVQQQFANFEYGKSHLIPKAIIVCGLILGILIIVGGSYRPYPVPARALVLGVVVILVGSGVGFLWLLLAWRAAMHQVIIFRDGFAYLSPRQRDVLRWEDVAEISFRLAISYFSRHGMDMVMPRETCKIWGPGRKLFVCEELTFGYANEICGVIQREVGHVKSALVLKRIAAGEVVEFGPLALTREGVQDGDRLLRWDQLEAGRVHEGHFFIETEDRENYWFHLPAAQIPEIHVLIALLRQKGPQRRNGNERGARRREVDLALVTEFVRVSGHPGGRWGGS